MRSGSPVLSRAVFIAVSAAWGIVAIAVGLLAMLEWPTTLGLPQRWGQLCGFALLAVGQFMSAIVADQFFPNASRLVTGAIELAPWVALVVMMVIGGLLWTR